MSIKRIFKGSLLCLLALGIISGLNESNASARYHRHTRRIRVIHKHKRIARRHFRYHKVNRRKRAKRFYRKSRRHFNRRKRSSKSAIKVSRKHRRRNKVRRGYMYLLDTEGDSGQLMDNDSFKNLRAGNGDSVCATSADDGELVHINGKAVVDGKVFYKISDKSDPIDTGWVYSGDLSYNPNGKSHPIDISSLPYPTANPKRSHSRRSSISDDLAEMQPKIINDINEARQNNGLAPLVESPELDQIANMRAKQAQKVYGHFDPNNGYGYADEDGYELGYNDSPSESMYSENLDELKLGTMPSQDSQHMYHNHNGIDLANDTVDNMLHHDAPNNWTHRNNLLDPNPKSVGVGVNYQKGQEWPFKVAEDFR